MQSLKRVLPLFVSAAFLSSTVFAYHSFKDEVPVVVAKPYNWTGFYAGLNAGVVRPTTNITDTNASTFNATLQQSSNPKFTGGFQVGYRYQMDVTKTSGVFGAELSADFSNATFNKQYGSPFALYRLNAKNELNSAWLLQLTGGIAADRTLLFLAAGFSWTDLSGNVTNLNTVPFFNSFSLDKKVLGTALGGGLEYAIGKRISARVKVDVITPNVYTTYNNTNDSFQITHTIVQATLGVNYNF